MKTSVVSASIRTLSVAALLASPLPAQAADPPLDLGGRWVGKTHTIVAGSGGHWPTSTGTFHQPALVEKDMVLEVTGQQGRRFWGVTTISGGGERTTEPFVGQLAGRDNRTVAMADTDGYFTGRLLDDRTLSFCYMHAGGKSQSTVVSCVEVTR